MTRSYFKILKPRSSRQDTNLHSFGCRNAQHTVAVKLNAMDDSDNGASRDQDGCARPLSYLLTGTGQAFGNSRLPGMPLMALNKVCQLVLPRIRILSGLRTARSDRPPT